MNSKIDINYDNFNDKLLNAMKKYRKMLLNMDLETYKLWISVSINLKTTECLPEYCTRNYCEQQFWFLVKLLSINVMRYETYEEVLENFPLFHRITEIPLIRFVKKQVSDKIFGLKFNASIPNYQWFDTSDENFFQRYQFPEYNEYKIQFFTQMSNLIDKHFYKNYSQMTENERKEIWIQISDQMNRCPFDAIHIDCKLFLSKVCRTYKMLLKYSNDTKRAKSILPLFDLMQKMSLNSMVKTEDVEEFEKLRKNFKPIKIEE